MIRFVINRFVYMILTLAAVSMVAFVLIQLPPGLMRYAAVWVSISHGIFSTGNGYPIWFSKATWGIRGNGGGPSPT
jgi:ABC-type dipeptide/oligopeptide/nickel transport system permease component